MTSACSFRVIGMDCPPFKRPDGLFNKSGLVQRVGVDGHRDIMFFSYGEGAVYRRRSASPSLRGASGLKPPASICSRRGSG